MNAVNQHVIDLQTVQAWCLDMSQSIKQRDLDKHMQLVSKKIKVYQSNLRQHLLLSLYFLYWLPHFCMYIRTN